MKNIGDRTDLGSGTGDFILTSHRNVVEWKELQFEGTAWWTGGRQDLAGWLTATYKRETIF